MAEATRGLDAVVTLSSLLLPCKIDDTPEVLKTYDQQCRLVFNVTGTPAISVPTGLSKSGMPLAMQIAAHAFDEPTVYPDRARLLRGGRHDHHRRSEDAAAAAGARTAAAETPSFRRASNASDPDRSIRRGRERRSRPCPPIRATGSAIRRRSRGRR